MYNHKKTTNSILFLSIPLELEAILQESVDEEIGRQPISFGTVISYLNEYVAADVYNYIRSRLGSNNLIMGLILPNFGDENRQNQNSQAAEVASSQLVRNYYTEDYGRNLHAKNYIKNYNTTPVVQTYQPPVPLMSLQTVPPANFSSIFNDSWRDSNATSSRGHQRRQTFKMSNRRSISNSPYTTEYNPPPYTTEYNPHSGSPTRPVYGSNTIRQLKRSKR